MKDVERKIGYRVGYSFRCSIWCVCLFFAQVGHIKRLQHGIRDIQGGKLPRRLLHPTCGVMAYNYDPGSTTSTSSCTPRMSQSSAYTSSFHASTLTVPPCDLPHIQISNTDEEEACIGSVVEPNIFNPEDAPMPQNN